MSFFSVGNLLTLGITALAFILYHQLNRRNASGLSKLREYIKTEKDKLSVFVTEKEAAIKDYGIDLDVRRQSAKELLNRLNLTDADLRKKADAITKIDERITGYDTSLEELVRMTGRVQENLNRIQDESVFVDSAVKRIAQAEEKLKSLELELAGVKDRYSAEQESALEKAVAATLAEVRFTVADLKTTVETIGRRVEDHREAVAQVEQDRETRLAAAEETIRVTLDNALVEAGAKAEKIEDAALVRLRDQALERVKSYQEAVEQKLKTYQEGTRAHVAEVQGLVKDSKESWNAEHESLRAREQAYHDEINGNIAAMEARFTDLEARITQGAAGLETLLHSTLNDAKAQAESLGGVELERWRTAVAEEDNRIRTLIAEWQAATGKELEDLAAASGTGLEKWRQALGDQDARSRQFLSERDAAIAVEAAQREQAFDETIADLEGRIKALNGAVEAAVARHEEGFAAALEAAETRARTLADGEFTRWTTAAAADAARWQEEAEKTARERQAAAETAAARWQETAETEGARWRSNAETAFTAWRTGFDADFSSWRGNTESVWTDLRDRTEAEYQELSRVREEVSGRWREAEDRWTQTAEEIAAAITAINERLKTAEAYNTGTVAELRESLDTTAAELWQSLNTTTVEQRQSLDTTAAELRQSLDTAATELRQSLDTTTTDLRRSLDTTTMEQRQSLDTTAADLRQSLDTTATDLRQSFDTTAADLQAALDAIASRLRQALEETDGRLQKTITDTAFDAEQKALEESDRRIEAYRAAQAVQFRNLEQVADDASRLEGELRRAMEDTENRVRTDFAFFESASAQERSAAAAAFDEAAESLRGKLALIEREVEALKTRAYENVSEKLDIFEEDFAGNLVKRSDAIQEKLDAWQETQNKALVETGEGLETRREHMELSLTEEMKARLAEQRERTEADLERLKTEADAFEAGIRDRMAQGDESLESFRTQITGGLAEARAAADAQVKAELGRFSLSMAESLKQARRDMEEWQEAISTQLKETNQLVEDLRRKSRDLSTDSDERLAGVRASIAEVNRQIQEFVDQTKLFDQAEKLKTELERRIEDLKGDMDGLDQRRAEAAELENQFIKIKRLEDEVNAKMTRFLSEQRRVELMEADFNRLLQTSQAVEEKLSEVSSSDDTLQAIQVQLRKINDALAETEEKYKRIERKNQTLETTNLGVDRNFRTLQETEASLKSLIEDMGNLKAEQEQIRRSLETLRTENEQAQATADRLTILGQDLSTVEERIKAMQVAREWLAQAETRMENLNRDMHEQLKLIGEITRDEGDGPARGSNPDSIATRENVHKLHRQGWKDDEIAKALKLGVGEVKLILEVPSRKGG